jgi:hypothetical protein
VPRKSRLRELQLIGELAHAALAAAQQRDDAQSDGIGERVKELGSSRLAVGSRQGSHSCNI